MGCEYAEYYEPVCRLGRDGQEVYLLNGFKGSSTKEGAMPKSIAKGRRRNKLAKKQRKFNRK